MGRAITNFLLIALIAALAFLAGAYGRHHAAAPSQQSANERVNKTGTLHCGYILYPPYMAKDVKTGRLQGVAYDLIEGLGRTLHKKIEWTKEIALGNEIPELEKGDIDAICAITGAYDANTFGQIAYSDYLFIVRNKIFARADDKRFNGPVHFGDLDKPDVKFAGIEGDTSYIFPHMLAPHAQMEELPALSETAQLFEDLKYKKADLIMVESLPGSIAMQSNPGAFKIVDMQDALPTYAMQIAVLKKDLALKDTLDEAIRFMRLNRQFDPILGKYDPTGQALFRPD